MCSPIYHVFLLTRLLIFSTSLRFHYLSLEAEIGYGLWAYGGDSIKFTTPFAQEYGIAGTVTIPVQARVPLQHAQQMILPSPSS